MTLNKVAQITVYFWILKIIATTLGETAGDMLSMTLDMGYLTSLGITFAILLVLLFTQIKSKAFHPYLYWPVIIATTTTGTEISDFMDRSLGLGYMAGSIILATCLAATLYAWHTQEKSLAVYPITQRKPEIFYWVAILFSNSLGTAFGDYLSDNLELSYLQGALVTAVVIGVVLALHKFTKLSHVLLFWIAFVFTRPFGATFGDFLTKPLEKGGLDLGTMQASAVALVVFVAVLVFSVAKEKKNIV